MHFYTITDPGINLQKINNQYGLTAIERKL